MPLDPRYKRLRIHPAIGVARISTNDDVFVFGERPAAYMSHDPAAVVGTSCGAEREALVAP
jgi:hypothetical protein